MDLTTFTDADLHDLSARISAEWERRRASTVTEQAVTEVITGLQDAGKITPPPAGEDVDTAQPWADPGTDHSAMYRQGVYVTHEGKTWLNTHPHLNHWPPGTLNSGWVDVTPPVVDGGMGEDATTTPIGGNTGEDVTTGEEPQIIAWDIGQAVEVGDLRTHDGQTWECILAHTTHEGWAPGPDTHAVWQPA